MTRRAADRRPLDRSGRGPAHRSEPGRHRRRRERTRTRFALGRRSAGRPRVRARLAQLFPGFFGVSRQAAWRRFVVRRAAAMMLVTAGVATAFYAGVISSAAA